MIPITQKNEIINAKTTHGIQKTKTASVPKLNIDWEHFRSDIDIAEVADLLGIEMVGKGGTFFCPSHNDTNNPSAKIRPKSNTWHCFTCGAGGTCLDLVQAVNGGTILEAAQYLEAVYPGGIEIVGETQEQEKEYEIPEPVLRQIGLKRNPFAVQTVRIPICMTGDSSDKNAIQYEQKKFSIDPLQAAELVLDHCMEYYNKHMRMSQQIKKIYPDLGQDALAYMEEKNKIDLAPVSTLAQDMRDIIAKEAKEYFPWDEIENAANKANKTVEELDL